MQSLGNIHTTMIESDAILMCTIVPDLTPNNYESAVLSPLDTGTSHADGGVAPAL